MLRWFFYVFLFTVALLLKYLRDGSCYHRLETNEPALKDVPEFRFAKRFSEVTYKELEPYLDLDYESSYIYNIVQFDLVIVEVKVRVKAKETELWWSHTNLIIIGAGYR